MKLCAYIKVLFFFSCYSVPPLRSRNSQYLCTYFSALKWNSIAGSTLCCLHNLLLLLLPFALFYFILCIKSTCNLIIP